MDNTRQHSTNQYVGKFTKLLIDSDIDGMTCAAMILRVFPGLEVHYSGPNIIQNGKETLAVDEKTIITDLPFIKGCGLYFDHHESNNPGVKFDGVWKEAGSAAHIVYDYFVGTDGVDLSDFGPFLPILDRFDSGDLTLEDVQKLDFVLKFIYSTKRVDFDYYNHLIKLLTREGPAGLQKDYLVAQKIKIIENDIEMMRAGIGGAIVRRDPPIVFIDLIDKPFSSVHITMIEEELFDNYIFCAFKKDGNSTTARLYDNGLNPEARRADGSRYDLLSVAKKMNSTHSGGHRSGCGFTLPSGMSLKECANALTPLLREVL